MSRDYRVQPMASQKPIEGLATGTRVTIYGIRGQDPITGPIISVQHYDVLARTAEGGLLPANNGQVYYYIELGQGPFYAYWKQSMDGGQVKLADSGGGS